MINLVDVRSQFHQYPETCWTEFWTTAQICKYLESFGFELLIGKDIIKPDLRINLPPSKEIQYWYQKAIDRGADLKYLEKMQGGFTGVIGIFDTGKVGPIIAYRADIDALFLKESTEEEHIPFKEGWRSENEGKMHGCGHDIHITIGLGIAEFISQNQNKLKGKFILIFSPAEEGGNGCLSISYHPIIKEIQYFFATHIGTLGFGDQPFILPDHHMRSVDTYRIQFESKNYRYIEFPEESTKVIENPNLTFSQKTNQIMELMGRVPEKFNNALKAACSAILNLHLINKRHDGISFINISQLHAGNSSYNAPIQERQPDPCSFNISIRGDTDDIGKYMLERSFHVLKATADMFNVNVKYEKLKSWTYPAWYYNSSNLIEYVKTTWKDMGYEENIIHKPFKEVGSDDVIYIMKNILINGGSAIYIILLSGNPDGKMKNVHDPCGKFNVMPTILKKGVELFTRVFHKIISMYD